MNKNDLSVQEVKGTPYNKITIGVPKETWSQEKRVALTPAATAMLTKKGFNVSLQITDRLQNQRKLKKLN